MPDAKLELVDTMADTVRLVGQGRADAIVENIDFFMAFTKNYPDVNWRVIGEPIDVAYCAIGVQQGNDEPRRGAEHRPLQPAQLRQDQRALGSQLRRADARAGRAEPVLLTQRNLPGRLTRRAGPLPRGRHGLQVPVRRRLAEHGRPSCGGVAHVPAGHRGLCGRAAHRPPLRRGPHLRAAALPLPRDMSTSSSSPTRRSSSSSTSSTSACPNSASAGRARPASSSASR